MSAVSGAAGGALQQAAALQQEIGTAVVKQQLDAEAAGPLAILNGASKSVEAATPPGVGDNLDVKV